MTTTKTLYENIRGFGLAKLADIIEYYNEPIYGCDLHNELYNVDYFEIYTHKAIKQLEEFGVFTAIEAVKDYELDEFGEVTTDLSEPVKLINMFAYIIGEEFLRTSKTLQSKLDAVLTIKDLKKIYRELQDEL